MNLKQVYLGLACPYSSHRGYIPNFYRGITGLGKPLSPLLAFWGALIKGVLTFSLTAMPTLGIRGAALGTVIGFLIAVFRNIFKVSKIIGINWFKFKDHLLKPAIAVIVME